MTPPLQAVDRRRRVIARDLPPSVTPREAASRAPQLSRPYTIGVWLLFAPIVFWTSGAAAYLQDTLIGALVIGAAILVPHGMMMPGPDLPPALLLQPIVPGYGGRPWRYLRWWDFSSLATWPPSSSATSRRSATRV